MPRILKHLHALSRTPAEGLNYSHSVCIARDRVEYIWTVISGQTIPLASCVISKVVRRSKSGPIALLAVPYTHTSVVKRVCHLHCYHSACKITGYLVICFRRQDFEFWWRSRPGRLGQRDERMLSMRAHRPQRFLLHYEPAHKCL
jgi:hypothetical protein